MKKIKVLSILFFLFMSISNFAQSNIAQLSSEKTNDLKTKLNLSVQQTNSVQALMLPYLTTIEQLKQQLKNEKTVTGREQIGKTAKTKTNQFQQALQNILTTEQKDELARIKAEK